MHLAQTRDDTLRSAARAAAERLGLEFEHRFTGYGDLEPFLARAGAGDGSRERTAPEDGERDSAQDSARVSDRISDGARTPGPRTAGGAGTLAP